MESPLEVLSRAATMVQDNANESRLTTKELPTAKWRRDRRLRASEYQHSISSSSSSSSPPSSPLSARHNNNTSPGGIMKPLTETTSTTNNSIECPIDMSVTSTTIKPRSPPPPYREPLPGSTFATALARPSVITQAPKRDNLHCMISSRENDNRNNCSTESISMCDPVIDEHFRRSLGADYMNLFAKKSNTSSPQQQPTAKSSIISPGITTRATTTTTALQAAPPTVTVTTTTTPPPAPPPPPAPTTTALPSTTSSTKTATVTINNNDSIGTSVDDHFAKALGDTWKKLQADKELKNENRGGGENNK